MFAGVAGTASITNQTDAVIGASGKPVRLFYVSALSDGTATTVTLYNGTSTGGTKYVQIDGTISKSADKYFGANGLLFPNGCFADVDAHTAALTVSYTQEL